MLTETGCRTRRKRLWKRLPESLEWALVADPRHVHYFSGFWVEPLDFSAGEGALLLLHRDGRAILIADNFVRRSASSDPFVDEEVVGQWYDHRHSVVSRDAVLVEALKRAADQFSPVRICVETSALPGDGLVALGAMAGAEEIDLGTIIRSLRRCKEEDEIILLKSCLRAAEAGHARALEVVRAGITEMDVYVEVQSACLAAAGRPVLVYGDFRATNGDVPRAGGLPTGYSLQDKDLFLLDFSVVIDGYRGDTTNTLHVGRSPTSGQSDLFELCRSALKTGEEALAPGVPARDIFQAVSGELESGGREPLGHHAGHGIGLAHPEPPILVPESDDHLKIGDVVTLEPGLYVEGIGGIRLEHNYLITPEGSERLSRHALSLT
jgi:Xaa-Pro aminopeptidase